MQFAGPIRVVTGKINHWQMSRIMIMKKTVLYIFFMEIWICAFPKRFGWIHLIILIVGIYQEANRIEIESQRRLLAERKLSLVIDLDQTILHATTDPLVAEWIHNEAHPNHPFVRVGRGLMIVFFSQRMWHRLSWQIPSTQPITSNFVHCSPLSSPRWRGCLNFTSTRWDRTLTLGKWSNRLINMVCSLEIASFQETSLAVI